MKKEKQIQLTSHRCGKLGCVSLGSPAVQTTEVVSCTLDTQMFGVPSFWNTCVSEMVSPIKAPAQAQLTVGGSFYHTMLTDWCENLSLSYQSIGEGV